jgi:glycosyltransferase involved in cell wall biosynthesis
VNKDPILFSVVIPTYNHAQYLSRALKSVINQSYPNWEIIVIDNNSTDNTLEIIKEFNNKNIKYMSIINKGIIAKSRNAGIKIARGEWIAFLDSDDYWLYRKLEICIDSIRKDPSVDIFVTNELQINEDSGARKGLIYGPFFSNFYKILLTYGNCLSPSAAIVKKDFLLKSKILFRESRRFISAEDYDFWMLLARSGAKFEFINSIQGVYTIHKKNMSKRIEFHNNNIAKVIEDHVFNLQNFEHNKNNLLAQIRLRLFTEALIKTIRFGSLSKCFKMFAKKTRTPAVFSLNFFLDIFIFKLKLYIFKSYRRVLNCLYLR